MLVDSRTEIFLFQKKQPSIEITLLGCHIILENGNLLQQKMKIPIKTPNTNKQVYLNIDWVLIS